MGETICIRCKQILNEVDSLGTLTRTCENCFRVLVSADDSRWPDYLELLDVPAAILHPDHTILLSNSRFQKMTSSSFGGVRIGERLECLYTRNLGRCGETIACQLCWLKRSVDHTWDTGEGLREVRVAYPHKTAVRKALTVSTEKIGNAVLLIIGTVSQ